MSKPTLLVLRNPESEQDQKRLMVGLALLEPYRMGISPQAERSVVEYMADRRYLGLSKEALAHEQTLEQATTKTAVTMENRGIVAGLIAVGGAGLLMLVSNRIKLSPEVIAGSLALIAAISTLILLPLLRKRQKDKA